MRVAKERLRMERAVAAVEAGRVTFEGPCFGGRHVIRYLDAGDESRLWLEVDGKPVRPRTWRGLMRLVVKRVMR